MAGQELAERVAAAVAVTDSMLCLGLDPEYAGGDLAAAERQVLTVLDAALPYVAAVKPNSAFFEQFGSRGMALLERVRSLVPADRVLILDVKRGDIGTTAQAYCRAAFDIIGADAVTVNPLMGRDSVVPFLAREGRGAFILTRTSNPGAADLLERRLDSGVLLYLHIADLVAQWDPAGRAGLVVGATAPDAVAQVRQACPDRALLVPGVGAQGGVLEQTIGAALSAAGTAVLINVSRGIAQAAEGPAAAARDLAERMRQAAAVAPRG